MIVIIKQKIDRYLDCHLSGKDIDYHQIIRMLIPLLVDQAFVYGLSFINTAMISSSGIAAVSAVNMVDTLNTFIMNIFIALSTGGAVIVAQYKGNSDDKMASKAASSSIITICSVAIFIVTIIVVFHNPILNFLFGNANADVMANARIYIIGSAVAFPAFAVFESVAGGLRGAGDTRSYLLLSLILNISYVLLNFIFINVLHMSVTGMVISLNIARVLGMVCSLVYMLKVSRTLSVTLSSIFHFDFSIIKKIFGIGLPFAAEQMFFYGGKILTQTFIVAMGTSAMTIDAICTKTCGLLQIGPCALQLCLITVVGQCMGRRDVDDAKKFIKSFLMFSSAMFIIAFFIIIPLLPLLLKLFKPDGDVMEFELIAAECKKLMLITGILQPFLWSFSFLSPAALRAAGDSKFTSVVSMLTMWLFRIIFGYVLGVTFNLGISGIWYAMISEWLIRGIIFSLRLRGKKWCEHHLID